MYGLILLNSVGNIFDFYIYFLILLNIIIV